MSTGPRFLLSWDVYRLAVDHRTYGCFCGGSRGSTFYSSSEVGYRLHFTWQLRVGREFNLRERSPGCEFFPPPKAACLRTSVPALSSPKLRHWLICKSWGWKHSWSSVESGETFCGWDFRVLFSWQTGVTQNSFTLQVCIKMHEACKAGAGRRKMRAICGNCGLLWLLNWHIYMLHCS